MFTESIMNGLGSIMQMPLQIMQMPFQMAGSILGGLGGPSTTSTGGGLGSMIGGGLTSMLMPLIIVFIGVELLFKLLNKI